ncbi:MAG: hypothetical protein LBU38_06435 [Propionibacteriaceae bacterium]|nr:hypothetical protein [Propionibacteriaceae bacterium]
MSLRKTLFRQRRLLAALCAALAVFTGLLAVQQAIAADPSCATIAPAPP